MQEKRKFIRIPESLEISYRYTSQSKTAKFLTRDISQGGVRFLAHEFITPHTYLKIKLNLLKPRVTFEALVKVQWVKKAFEGERYEVGAEFIDISQQVLDRLKKYIENNPDTEKNISNKEGGKNDCT